MHRRPGRRRGAASADLGPARGLHHHGDVNLAIGDQVELVRSRAEAAS